MIVLLLALVAASPQGWDQLQPGAEGKLCLECHKDFAAVLKRPFVHTPVKGRKCIACHDPHASQHEKLLSADANRICQSCHEGLVSSAAKSVHEPVRKGSCLGCHDPHASNERSGLRKPAGELCASCHQAIATGAAQARHKHLGGGGSACMTCHEPHASDEAAKLLKAEQPTLCLGCHKSGAATFVKAHAGYPVQQARCTSCHDPHGSNQAGMLYSNVHKPLAARQCGECHAPPSAKKPFEARAAGPALCKTCHSAQIARMLKEPEVHWAVVDQRGCLNCHNPHASKTRGLIDGTMTQACGRCHEDTFARQAHSPTRHPPVAEGECTTCHEPHSSANALLMKKADLAPTCNACHDYAKHQSHPIGAKLKDPRNPNLSMTCLSCHRAHGTEYKHLMPTATTTDLCTKCHKQYVR